MRRSAIPWALALCASAASSAPAASSAAPAEYAAGNNFTTSCTNITMVPSSISNSTFSLKALCVSNSTSTSKMESSLDLNLCIGINQATAELAWSIYGKYSNSCKTCHVGDRELSCTCESHSYGAPANSSLDLDEGIVVFNGALACKSNVPTSA